MRYHHLVGIRTDPTTAPWQQSNQLRRPDGSVARILRARALETWRRHRRAAMRRGSARYAQLVKLSRARGCSREVAKEVVQEAHLRLLEYQRSAKLKDPESLLRRIVINLSINYYRRELPRVLASESIDRLAAREMLLDFAPGPERTMMAEQELDRVVSIVSALSSRTCQIFIAQRGGYSYEEIASAFAVKPRTVEKHVAHATLTLAEMMPAGLDSP